MVSHSLAKYVKNIVDDMYWLKDTPPPAVDALYWDFLRINEWLNLFILKKKKKKKKKKRRKEVTLRTLVKLTSKKYRVISLL